MCEVKTILAACFISVAPEHIVVEPPHLRDALNIKTHHRAETKPDANVC